MRHIRILRLDACRLGEESSRVLDAPRALLEYGVGVGEAHVERTRRASLPSTNRSRLVREVFYINSESSVGHQSQSSVRSGTHLIKEAPGVVGTSGARLKARE